MITIVSGLPRSGTSLMMQMLAAGGVPVLTDGERRADTDNPRGYYEWERIKQLPQEPDCIDEAEDKALKVVSQLLFALPARHDYQILFMERPLIEVVASQGEMIRHRGTSGAAVSDAAMIAGLQAHLNQVKAWLQRRPDILLCCVEYHQVLRDPRCVSETVQRFLQWRLDLEAMVQQVDQSLYRCRVQGTT
ncbi:MAG: hypothetical protein WCC99_00715 [Candidatus Sulfotelmatobacter sp.]